MKSRKKGLSLIEICAIGLIAVVVILFVILPLQRRKPADRDPKLFTVGSVTIRKSDNGKLIGINSQRWILDDHLGYILKAESDDPELAFKVRLGTKPDSETKYVPEGRREFFLKSGKRVVWAKKQNKVICQVTLKITPPPEERW